MKKCLTCLLILSVFWASSQDFYDLSTVQTIEITFEEGLDWDKAMDDEKAGDENYILAESISINGTVYDSVGVKYKGNSTYNANQTKNPFHIELDTYKEHEHEGYSDIKLSNVANDPSFVREVLSYQILRQYMDAPLSNYANVYINGELIGLYSNSEAINKDFLKDRFDSKKNTFVKCNPPAGAGQGTTDFPNLVYMGVDSTDYYASYEIKSDYGWEELINLTDTLENNIDHIEEILDVDRALWMLAFDNVFVNLDSYIGAFAQNYYLYRDDNNRFLPVVWDLNESFGRFSDTGDGTLNSTANKQQMTHLLHENNNDYPLVKMLLSNPMYKRMYLAHYKTMLLENFDDGSYYVTGQELQATIDADVNADPNKFFTYANFQDNLTTEVSTGGGPRATTTLGITQLMDVRNDYLLALSDFTVTEPEISNVLLSDDLPIIGTEVSITAEVTNENAVYVGYREDSDDIFVRYEMFDDGAHNDGSAGDGIYGVAVTVADSYSQYYIYAENDDAGFFSPRRAEYEYHIINATVAETEAGDVVINELMASNDVTQADQDGEFDDWIELYNNTDEDIDLGGYYLSDDADDLMLWEFPASAFISANGYLIVWADKDTLQDGLHANFKLSASSESVFLVNASGGIEDEVVYRDQETDSSYARLPNGTGDFEIAIPTYEEENKSMITGLFDTEVSNVNIAVSPNPSNGSFNLMIEGTSDGNEVTIYDLTGNVVYNEVVEGNATIDSSGWFAGLYIVRVKNTSAKIYVNTP